MTERRLSPAAKLTYGLGDLTLSAAMTAMTMVYAGYFLTQEAGLRPALAGLVPLIGRVVDAVTDPWMGRLSDRTTWAAGRRRPYFLIGAIPFGLAFAALWVDAPFEGQAQRFAYYAAAYSVFSVALTVLYIPYLALIPEMARGYDERTSLNAYRSAVGSLGLVAAIGIRPLAEWVGEGRADFATVAAIYGALMALPWLAVHRASFEPLRRAVQAAPRGPKSSLRGFAEVARHRSFRWLCALYLLGRMAMDIAGGLFILYAAFWLGRRDDFELVMLIFFATALCSYPFVQRFALSREKAWVFFLGASAWAFVSLGQYLVQPEWPRWMFFILIPLIAPGFAVVELMPWSMIGEVADEGELESGERRDGVYNGVFSFVRKFGGAIGVALTLGLLDLAGFKEAEGGEVVVQTEAARQAIRALSAFMPALLLAIGAGLALRYPLTRARHAEITASLVAGEVAADAGPAPAQPT